MTLQNWHTSSVPQLIDLQLLLFLFCFKDNFGKELHYPPHELADFSYAPNFCGATSTAQPGVNWRDGTAMTCPILHLIIPNKFQMHHTHELNKMHGTIFNHDQSRRRSQTPHFHNDCNDNSEESRTCPAHVPPMPRPCHRTTNEGQRRKWTH